MKVMIGLFFVLRVFWNQKACGNVETEVGGDVKRSVSPLPKTWSSQKQKQKIFSIFHHRKITVVATVNSLISSNRPHVEGSGFVHSQNGPVRRTRHSLLTSLTCSHSHSYCYIISHLCMTHCCVCRQCNSKYIQIPRILLIQNFRLLPTICERKTLPQL